MSAKPTVLELQKAADQCVKCAVCLPHCPTYALSAEETESPRGRITLLQGIVYEHLEPTPDVDKHLNNCLNCGRCEQVCPARVPYTRLLDGTRAFMQDHPKMDASAGSVKRQWAAWLLASPRALGATAFLARLAKRLRFDKAIGSGATTHGLKRWLSWLPPNSVSSAPPTVLASEDTRSSHAVHPHSDAWLFAGCLTDAFESDLAVSVHKLALAHGFHLKAAPAGLCCGALYQHLGNAHQTRKLAARNIEAVASDGKPVVVLPSGCARGLGDGLGFSDHPSALDTQSRITDIFSLLDTGSVDVEYSTGQDVVGIYLPCSADKNASDSLRRMFNRALGHDVAILDKGHGCCGAAGDHMLDQHQKADDLAAPIVEEIMSLELTHVLTPNVGCAWHLRANLAQRGVDIIVEHPVSWLVRHMIQSLP